MPEVMRKPSDGDVKFSLGMLSSYKPSDLPPGAYYRSFNTILRGDRLQCRPGYKFRLNLPAGNIQGMFLFEPIQGLEQIVIVIAGKVYTSNAPFDEYAQVPGLQFDANTDQVWFAQCERSLKRNADLSLSFIDTKSILVIQDGLSAPGSWDGAVGQHHKGLYALPQGTAMAWSGGRLWVARGRSLFASDYADPLTFFEGQYIGDTNAFILPSNITAMAEVPNVQSPKLLVFTANTTTAFLSGFRTRNLWATTENFQTTILPDIGCSSQRSIVATQGQIYWFCAHGLTRLDVARQGYVEGRYRVIDTDMAISKYRVDPDVSLIAGCAFESYLLMSVPHGSVENTHTWCLDMSGADVRWAGYWVGTRPACWISGSVNDQARCFFLSHDYDGYNRLWEAFSDERTDNGCPITWGFETRAYRGDDTSTKVWRNAELRFTDIIGEVDVAVSSAGTFRGRFKRIGTKRISSAQGTVGVRETIASDENLYAFKSQSRVVQTEDDRLRSADILSSCCLDPDVDREEHIDFDFQLCVLVNGAAAVDRIRVWFDNETEQYTANCPEDETGIKAARFDGGSACGTADEVLGKLAEPKVVYEGVATDTQEYSGVTAVGSAVVSTSISQKCADKMAACTASMRAAHTLKNNAPGKLGGFLVECLPSDS